MMRFWAVAVLSLVITLAYAVGATVATNVVGLTGAYVVAMFVLVFLNLYWLTREHHDRR